LINGSNWRKLVSLCYLIIIGVAAWDVPKLAILKVSRNCPVLSHSIYDIYINLIVTCSEQQ
jgi:hypothetical protein